MKVLILGSDGYIGYKLTLHLLKRGYDIAGVDNGSRRRRVEEIGSNSLTPISTKLCRHIYLSTKFDNWHGDVDVDLGESSYGYIRSVIDSFQPDCIVHLAEMPSAPWSMRDASFAAITQMENVIGTLHILWAMKEVCPKAHLLKLGTMGEYGTPNCDIPEGFIEDECMEGALKSGPEWALGPIQECPMKGLLFPRQPGSFYHLSKVHDTFNIEFACRNWGLRSTDIMQGVVFGLGYEDRDEPEEELTRFDYDEYFGTAINRFCTQAIIEHPLTVYGKGDQTRGFLTLQDSINCLTLAIENPPEAGKYRTFNQFENIYTINQLAGMIFRGANSLGIGSITSHIHNPRKEAEEHYYNPTHEKLFNLGYKPDINIQLRITELIRRLLPYKDRVIPEVIMPKTRWR